MACLLENVVSHLLVQQRISLADLQILRAEDSPRSHGELHHRHHRMDLARAHDQALVEFVLVDVQEAAELTAADHVRTCIRMSEKSCSDHGRHEPYDSVPRVLLVAESLHERLAAHLPACAELVVREQQSQLCPKLSLLSIKRFAIIWHDVLCLVSLRVAGVELESVNTKFLLHLDEDRPVIFESLRVAEVIACAQTVPPVEDRRTRAVGSLHKVSLLAEPSELLAIRRNERAYPEHYLKS